MTDTSYDADGNPVTVTHTLPDNSTQSTTTSYDDFDRPLAVHAGTDTSGALLTTWTYDTASNGIGRLRSATQHATIAGTDVTSTVSTDSYDPQGDPTSVTYTLPALSTGTPIDPPIGTSPSPSPTTNATTNGVTSGAAGARASAAAVTPADGPITSPPVVPTPPSYIYGYGYDAAGHQTSMICPAMAGMAAETVATSYSRLGLAQQVSGAYGYVTNTDYTPTLQLAARDLPLATGTLHRAFAWDDATDRLTSVASSLVGADGTATPIQQDDYGYDPAGNLTAIGSTFGAGDPATRQCFGYDGRDRLTHAFTTDFGDFCTDPATVATSTGLDPSRAGRAGLRVAVGVGDAGPLVRDGGEVAVVGVAVAQVVTPSRPSPTPTAAAPRLGPTATATIATANSPRAASPAPRRR